MSGYLDTPTRVLRSTEPRPVESEPRTRFTVVTTMIPFDGPAPCSVCPESGTIGQAVGSVRYDSALLRSWADEPTCLPHLPELIHTLLGFNEGPLEVALYSPCAMATTPRVRRLDHDRKEHVQVLAAARRLPMVTQMFQSLFTAVTAELHRVAGWGA